MDIQGKPLQRLSDWSRCKQELTKEETSGACQDGSYKTEVFKAFERIEP